MPLLLLVALLTPATADAAKEGGSGKYLSGHDRVLLEELNRARSAHGLAPLRVDASLQNAAKAHSTDMARRGYMAHGDFAGRMHRYGVRGAYLAENVGWASGRQRAQKIVGMWLQSPGHRANVLRAGFRRVGVAGVVGQIGGFRALLATADFAGH